jgi:hypothetical protein
MIVSCYPSLKCLAMCTLAVLAQSFARPFHHCSRAAWGEERITEWQLIEYVLCMGSIRSLLRTSALALKYFKNAMEIYDESAFQ